METPEICIVVFVELITLVYLIYYDVSDTCFVIIKNELYMLIIKSSICRIHRRQFSSHSSRQSLVSWFPLTLLSIHSV